MFRSRHKDWGPLKTGNVMTGCWQTGVKVWVGWWGSYCGGDGYWGLTWSIVT